MRTYVPFRWILPGLTAVVVAALLVIGAPAASADQQQVFAAQMSGAQVVPGPGDPDGTGTATITTDRQAGTVCAVIHTENVTEQESYNPILGILLLGVGPEPSPNDPGAIVLVLSRTESTNPDFEGCQSATTDLIKEMEKYPHRFYVEVTTFAYPGGAVRGQLAEVAEK